MKKLILFFSLFTLAAISYGQGNWTISGAKNRWANGMGFGNKDTSTYTNASDTNLLILQYPGVLVYRHLLTDHWEILSYNSTVSNYKLISDSLFNAGYTRRDRTKQGLDSLGALKLNISDTAAMLSNRLKISDTLTMLSTYLRKSDTTTMLLPYLRKTDTSNMLLPYLRKTDTLTMLLPYLRKTDTATMLTGYTRVQRFLDTTSTLRTLINTKGTGTVTSVGLSLPSIFSVSGSPVTTSGNLTGTLVNQNANLVFASPTTGSPATPSFRQIVNADLTYSTISGVSLGSNLFSHSVSYGLTGTSYNGSATISDWKADSTELSTKLNVLNQLNKYTGTSNTVTVGTIGTGVWQGTAISDSYISSATTWNNKVTSLTAGAGISIGGTTTVPIVTSTITQYTDALARASLSFAAGSGGYNSTTGVITIPTNNNQITNGAGYITGNQTITLSGDVSGSGTTAITTTIGASKVTNAMLAGSIDYAKMNSGTVPTWNQNTTGTAANITATSNSTITTLSSLSLPYSQLTGTPTVYSSFYLGTTAIALNRTSASQTLTGVSIDGNSATTTLAANSSLLQGYGSATTATAATIALRDGNSDLFAAHFWGSGSGLTGTAAGLSIGGNAATATTATQSTYWGGTYTANWSSSPSGALNAIAGIYTTDGEWRSATAAQVAAFINGQTFNTLGNAATVTNGVYTIGNQSIGGSKDFTSALLNSGMTQWTSGARGLTTYRTSDGKIEWNSNADIKTLLGYYTSGDNPNFGSVTASALISGGGFTGNYLYSRNTWSNTFAGGSYWYFTNAGDTRQWLLQPNASEGLDWWFYNGGASVKFSISNTGTMTASSIVKSGGISTQFLKADGSVDGSTYLTASSSATLTNKSGNISQWTNDAGFLTSAVTSITGTANQITASASTGAVTLSLPTDVTISGNMTAAAFFESSDKRLKNYTYQNTSFDGLSTVSFHWKKELNRDTRLHWGYLAQDVEKILPDQVNIGADGYKTVNYIEVLVYKIAQLEKRITQLENKNK